MILGGFLFVFFGSLHWPVFEASGESIIPAKLQELARTGEPGIQLRGNTGNQETERTGDSVCRTGELEESVVLKR